MGMLPWFGVLIAVRGLQAGETAAAARACFDHEESDEQRPFTVDVLNQGEVLTDFEHGNGGWIPPSRHCVSRGCCKRDAVLARRSCV